MPCGRIVWDSLWSSGRAHTGRRSILLNFPVDVATVSIPVSIPSFIGLFGSPLQARMRRVVGEVRRYTHSLALSYCMEKPFGDGILLLPTNTLFEMWLLGVQMLAHKRGAVSRLPLQHFKHCARRLQVRTAVCSLYVLVYPVPTTRASTSFCKHVNFYTLNGRQFTSGRLVGGSQQRSTLKACPP